MNRGERETDPDKADDPGFPQDLSLYAARASLINHCKDAAQKPSDQQDEGWDAVFHGNVEPEIVHAFGFHEGRSSPAVIANTKDRVGPDVLQTPVEYQTAPIGVMSRERRITQEDAVWAAIRDNVDHRVDQATHHSEDQPFARDLCEDPGPTDDEDLNKQRQERPA